MSGNGDDLVVEGGLGFGEEEGEEDRRMNLFEGSLMGRNGSKDESSGCSGEEPHDLQHKRAKVYVDAVGPDILPSLAGATSLNGFLDVLVCSPAPASDKNTISATWAFGEIGLQYPSEFLDPICDTADADNTSLNDDSELRMDLTDDLLHMVFSVLGHLDLCRAAIVCRQWRAASAHEDFWRCLNFENRNISAEQFEDMCRRYPNATKVNITGVSVMNLRVMKAVSSLRNLEALTLGRATWGYVFYCLGGLSLLELIKCRVVEISVRCPQLESLSLKRTFRCCNSISGNLCPLLEYLDMSNCSCVSDETLREISQTCLNLHELNASYCPNISLESVRLTMLTVLKLDNCEGITSASMVAIANSHMLEVLELDNCSLLTSVSLELSQLRNIRLVHCRKIADLSLRTLMLSTIMVSNCPVLNRINISSNSLQTLALQKQESLTTLALHCQSLEEVDLTDCESVTNSICDVFSDGGGCPLLRSLVLDNCESLTAVHFCSNSLTRLSLAGCRAITSLELACPYLQQVCLDGCDHLEKATFYPAGLRLLNLGICPKLGELNIEAPQMTVLELKGCGVLANASINCPLLTSLDFSFCSQLRDDCLSAAVASCPLIKSLVLMSCPSVGCDGLYSLCLLAHLTSLDLSYTFLTNLLPVFKSCTQLKVLKLQACKYLLDSALEPLYKDGALPAIRELDLSYGTLCPSAIEELLACCTHLTHVSLNGCANMHDLDWGCNGGQPGEMECAERGTYNTLWKANSSGLEDPPERSLQSLLCVGCPNIRKVHIPPAARCCHLLILNLSLSANLKEVDISCLNLSVLNLSNCLSLEILKLACPKLASLSLQGCNLDEEGVEYAISKCTMLETLNVRLCPKMCLASMGRLRSTFPNLKRIFSSL
ncbi:hypothetical protein MLD38_014712 [Melastoma candidum]|uniref:Uncharacterized protein n=1 Tax=Melastoma candidum TaxID=119954 RepID=A0ACB9RGS3_9MYRT|nr:hypothetical protein MLD38_014712 [Melastoma candidum]